MPNPNAALANPWAGGYPGATTAPNSGMYTYPLPRQGLAAPPGGFPGTTNYFLNGQPIAGGDIAGALAGIQSGGIPSATPTGQPQFDPSAAFNQQTLGQLPGLNTSGVNPYLNDPLMSSYFGLENPMYQQQQNFYGDPELFSAPSVGRATGG